MLSIDRCRQLLGPAAGDMTDAQIERLRDQLYGLADITVSIFLEKEDNNNRPKLSSLVVAKTSPSLPLSHSRRSAGRNLPKELTDEEEPAVVKTVGEA